MKNIVFIRTLLVLLLLQFSGVFLHAQVASKYPLADAIVKQQYPDSVISRDDLSNIKAYRTTVEGEEMQVYSLIKFDISDLSGMMVEDANVTYRGKTGASELADGFLIDLYSLKSGFDPETVTWGNKPKLDKDLGTSVLGEDATRTGFTLDGNLINEYINNALLKGETSISFAFVSSGTDGTDNMWIGGKGDGSYAPAIQYKVTPMSQYLAIADAVVKEQYPDSVIDRDDLSNMKAYRTMVEGEEKQVYSLVKFDISQLNGQQIEDANVTYRGVVNTDGYADEFFIDIYSLKDNFDPETTNWSNKPGLKDKLGTSKLNTESARRGFSLDGNKLDEYINNAIQNDQETIAFAFVSSGKDDTDDMWIGGVRDGVWGPTIEYTLTPETNKFALSDVVVKEQYPDSVIDRADLSNMKAYRITVEETEYQVYSMVKFDIGMLKGQQIKNAQVTYRGKTNADEFTDDFMIDLYGLKSDFEPETTTWGNKPGLGDKLGTSLLGGDAERTGFDLQGNSLDAYINEAIRAGQSTVSFALVSSGNDGTSDMWIGGVRDGSYGPTITYTITPESSKYGIVDAVIKQQYPDSVIDRSSLSNMKAYREKVGGELLRVYSMIEFDISGLKGVPVEYASLSYRGVTNTEGFGDNFKIDLHSLKSDFDPETVTWNNRPGLDKKLATSILGSDSERREFTNDGSKLVDYINNAVMAGKSTVSFAFVSSGKDSTNNMWIGGVADGSWGPVLEFENESLYTPENDTLWTVADTYVSQVAGEEDSNFGTAADMHLIKDADNNASKQLLLKYDISEVDDNAVVGNATLNMYLAQHNSGAQMEDYFIEVLGVDDQSWHEYAVTWNTKPEASTDVLLEANIQNYNSGKYHHLTSPALIHYINDAVEAGKDSVTFLVRGKKNTPGNRLWSAGKEWKNESYLALDYNAAPPAQDMAVVADAYVSQEEPETNYGDPADQHLINDDSNDKSKWNIFKYDISGAYGEPVSASLKIYGSIHESSTLKSFTFEFYAAESSEWEETTVTWQNKPADEDEVLLKGTLKAGGAWYTLSSPEFTEFIQAAIDRGDQYVTLYAKGATETPGQRAWFSGKEWRGSSLLLNYEPEVAFPAFSPQPGDYVSSVNVKISTSTSGATIYYTLDGTEPTDAATLYDNATGIILTDTTEVKTIAYADELNPSPVASGIYNVTPASVPEFSPDPKIEYQDNVTVKLTAEPESAVILFSTDGSEPAQQYNAETGIPLSSTTTIKTKSLSEDGEFESKVAEATYTIISTVAGAGTGPGGVGFIDNTRTGQPVNSLWLSADAIADVEDGASVTLWEDMSGNENNAVNTFADDGDVNYPNTNVPQAEPPVFVADGINGMPVLNFGNTRTGGNNDMKTMMVPDADNLDGGSGLSIFMVYKRNEMFPDFAAVIQKRDIRGSDPAKQAWVLEQNGGSDPHEIQLVLTRDLFLRNGEEFNAEDYYLINSDYSSSRGLALFNTDGVQQNALPYSKSILSTEASVVLGGYQPMNVAEVIYYNQGLNSAQRTIVNNYLAAKYGLNLYDENGNVVNIYDDQDYKFGMIGIGMEDSDNKHTYASGSALTLQESGSSLADGEYLMAGHNGGDIDDSESWTRSWYIKPVGDVDAVIGFDFSATELETPADVTEYKLFYDDGSGNGFAALDNVATLNGDVVTFDLSSVAEGIYGFGINEPGTGGCAGLEKPVITVSGEDGSGTFTLSSSYDEGNQWMIDGTAIDGATNKTFSPEETGSFTVSVTVDGCDPIMSEPLVVTSLEDQLNSMVNVYPNPTLNKLQVTLNSESIKNAGSVSLVNLTGHRIAVASFKAIDGQLRADFNTSGLAKGIYLIVVQTTEGTITKKVQKL